MSTLISRHLVSTMKLIYYYSFHGSNKAPPPPPPAQSAAPTQAAPPKAREFMDVFARTVADVARGLDELD